MKKITLPFFFIVIFVSTIMMLTTTPSFTSAQSSFTGLGTNISYKWPAPTFDSTLIEWTFTGEFSNNYFAVSIATGTGMLGVGVSCAITSTTSANCSAINTLNASPRVSHRTDNDITVVSATNTGTTSSITVRLSATLMSLTQSEQKRILFASAPWDATTQLPTWHNQNKGSQLIMMTIASSEPGSTTAVPSTTTLTSTTTATVTPAPRTYQISGAISGKLSASWTWAGSFIEITLVSPIAVNQYMALSLSAATMIGKGVVCVQPQAGATTTDCSGITTRDYGVDFRMDGALAVLSASTDATNAYVTVRLTAADMGLTASTTTARVIVAVGNYDGNNGLPTYHGANKQALTGLTFTQMPGPSTVEPSTMAPPATTETVTTINELGGNMTASWEWTGDFLQVSFSAPNPQYVSPSNPYYWALSISSDSFMQGKGVACRKTAYQTSSTVCTAINTLSAPGVSKRDDPNLYIVAASTDEQGSYVTVRVTASLLGLVSGQSQRVLYAAAANWNETSGLPGYHGPSKGAQNFTFIQKPGPSATPAPSTTTAPPTTTATVTPAPPTYQISGAISGKVSASWTWAGSFIEITLVSPIAVNQYMALSLSASTMVGKGVVCVQPQAGATTTDCSGITTRDYGVDFRMDGALAVLSASTDATNAYVTVRLTAADMGLTTSTSTARVIVAVGNYDGNNGLPTYHGANKQALTGLTFTQMPGPSTVEPSTMAPPATTETVTTINELGGNMTASWEWTGDFLQVSFSAPNPQYVSPSNPYYWALSISSDSFMQGKGVACRKTAYQTSSTVCTAINTLSAPGVSKRDDPNLYIVAASTDEQGSYVTVRVTASLLGLVSGQSQRVLYAAAANWNETSGLPGYHGPSKGAQNFTFIQKPGPSATPAQSTTTSGPSGVVTSSTIAPTPTTTSEAPSSISVMNGDLDISWKWTLDLIEFTFVTKTTTGEYMAVGNSLTNSESDGMGGKAVFCRRYIPADSRETLCAVIDTSANFQVTPRVDPAAKIVSSSSSDGASAADAVPTTTIVVQLNATLMGITDPGYYRLIWAAGKLASSKFFPTYHNGNRGHPQVAITREGGPTLSPSTTTTAVPTTVAPVTANSISLFGGQSDFQWERPELLGNFTMTLTSKQKNEYLAVGWSKSGMTGSAISAIVLPNGSPRFRVLQTKDYGITPLAMNTNVFVSSAVFSDAQNKWTMTLTFPTSLFPIQDAANRMIFARGTWDIGNNKPFPHTSENKYSASINLFSGAVKAGEEEGKRFLIAMIGNAFAIIFIAMIGAFLKTCNGSSLPSTQRNVRLLIFFLLLLGMASVWYAAYLDYEENGEAAPPQRAVGAATCYPFMLILLPTNKFLNIGFLAGASWERFLNFHVVAGFTVFVMMLLHFSLMTAYFTKQGMAFGEFIQGKNFDQPILPAFIGLILLFIMALFGMARRKYYAAFRISHILAIGVLVCGCIHYNGLIFALIPGVTLYLCDWIFRLVTQSKANTELVSCDYDPEARVTELKVRVNDFSYQVGPGQFALLTIPNNSLIPHPFTIAHVDDGTTETSNEYGTVTYQRGAEGSKVLTFMIKELGGFTKKLGLLAQENKIGPVSVTRPLGLLSVDLGTSPVAFLCAGGIGITPILSLARYVGATAVNQRNNNGVRHLRIVWSVREPTLLDRVRPLLEDIVKLFEKARQNNIIFGQENGAGNGSKQSSNLYKNTDETAVPIMQAQESGGGYGVDGYPEGHIDIDIMIHLTGGSNNNNENGSPLGLGGYGNSNKNNRPSSLAANATGALDSRRQSQGGNNGQRYSTVESGVVCSDSTADDISESRRGIYSNQDRSAHNDNHDDDSARIFADHTHIESSLNQSSPNHNNNNNKNTRIESSSSQQTTSDMISDLNQPTSSSSKKINESGYSPKETEQDGPMINRDGDIRNDEDHEDSRAFNNNRNNTRFSSVVGGRTKLQGNTNSSSTDDVSIRQSIATNTVANPHAPIRVISGRPNFTRLFADARNNLLTSATERTKSLAVYSCGPKPFMKNVEGSAKEMDCLLHEETFEL